MNSLIVGKCTRVLSNTSVMECICRRWYICSKTLVNNKHLLPVRKCSVKFIRPFTVWDIERIFKRWQNPRTIDLFRKDQLSPDAYSLIYRRDFFTKWGWLLSHITVIISAIGSFYSYQWYVKERKTEDEILEFEDERYLAFLPPVAFLFVVLPYFLIFNRTVPRIYFNREKQHFLMVNFNLLNPFKMNRMVFYPGEGTKKNVGQVMAIFGNARVKDKNVILFEDCFKLPLYSNVVFGYERKDALKDYKDLEDPDVVFRRKEQSNR